MRPEARALARWTFLAALAAPLTASAQRAAYATVDELPTEGLPHLADVSLGLRYQRTLSPDAAPLTNAVTFGVRTRALLGRSVGYCVGLDGDVGGSDAGFTWGVTGWLLGAGARWGAGNGASLCGGAGLGATGSAVPFAGRFPVELSVAQSLGPVRVNVWASVAWTVGDDLRRNGSPSLSFADEAEAGVRVRFGRQHHYWSTTNAGGGPSLAVVYREFMGARAIGVVLGIDLTGAR